MAKRKKRLTRRSEFARAHDGDHAGPGKGLGLDGRSLPRTKRKYNSLTKPLPSGNEDPRSLLSPTMQVDLTLAPGEVRLFARLITFDFSCPKCGRLYQLTEPGRSRAKGVPQYKVWDPRSARFCCRYCSLVVLLGVVAWPMSSGRGMNYSEATPPDVVPTPREAAEMRVQASYWAKPVDVKLPRRAVNVVRRKADAQKGLDQNTGAGASEEAGAGEAEAEDPSPGGGGEEVA